MEFFNYKKPSVQVELENYRTWVNIDSFAHRSNVINAFDILIDKEVCFNFFDYDFKIVNQRNCYGLNLKNVAIDVAGHAVALISRIEREKINAIVNRFNGGILKVATRLVCKENGSKHAIETIHNDIEYFNECYMGEFGDGLTEVDAIIDFIACVKETDQFAYRRIFEHNLLDEHNIQGESKTLRNIATVLFNHDYIHAEKSLLGNSFYIYLDA